MSNDLTFSFINEKTAIIQAIDSDAEIYNYSDILKRYVTDFRRVENQLQWGTIKWIQGWILDLSVTTNQIPRLLAKVIPILVKKEIAFSCVRNVDIATRLQFGELGLQQLGKVISIYPDTEVEACELAKLLIKECSDFNGPSVPTDRNLKGIVYTRYGAGNGISLYTNGFEETYIYDPAGNLIPEPIGIPFFLPDDLTWPFIEIATSKQAQATTILQDKYKTMEVIKVDAKGSVKKALWLKKIYHIKWCIVKEGKQHMSGDAAGRDMRDRLRWQYELHRELQESLPIPKAHDLFEENGDMYMAMDYIQGIALDHLVGDSFNGRTWWRLSLEERNIILEYAEQVITIIEKMHELGYIHRDITPANFMVDKDNQLVMIDLELSYCEKISKPDPPFMLGTPGFMSPEQRQNLKPTIEQDVFAIGGILVFLLTGFLPDKFAVDNTQVLNSQLTFFIRDEVFITSLVTCFEELPEKRPNLISVKNALIRFKEIQSVSSHKLVYAGIEVEAARDLILKSIQGLSYRQFTNGNLIWLSKYSPDEIAKKKSLNPTVIKENLGDGIAGTIYTLSIAHQLGYSIRPAYGSYSESLNYLQKDHIKKVNSMPGGLYTGSSGIALALISAIECSLAPKSEEIIQQIKSYFDNSNIEGYDVVSGLSGKGLALLRSQGILEESFVKNHLDIIITELIKKQEKDGSWLSISNINRSAIKNNGYGLGISGVISFLLEYSNKYPKQEGVILAIQRGLHYLKSQAQKQNGGWIWTINNKTKEVSSSFLHGVGGILSTLIKSELFFNELIYRDIITDTLNSIPAELSLVDLTIANGVSGTALLYLQAISLLHLEQYQEKLDWIMQFINHHYKIEKDYQYWISDNTPVPSTSLLTGNSGIIYLLLKYTNLELNSPNGLII